MQFPPFLGRHVVPFKYVQTQRVGREAVGEGEAGILLITELSMANVVVPSAGNKRILLRLSCFDVGDGHAWR